MVEKAEVHHSAHDDAKKNPKQLSLVKPEQTHHLPKDGNNSNPVCASMMIMPQRESMMISSPQQHKPRRLPHEAQSQHYLQLNPSQSSLSWLVNWRSCMPDKSLWENYLGGPQLREEQGLHRALQQMCSARKTSKNICICPWLAYVRNFLDKFTTSSPGCQYKPPLP